MATTRVQLPDGNIGEFPATMKPEEIEAVLAKQFPPESAPPPVPKAPDAVMSAKPMGLTDIDPHAMPHSMTDVGKEGLTALSNIGAGGLGLLSTAGRMTAVPDLLMGKPTIYQEGFQALKHPWDTLQSMGHAAQEHPLETLEQTIGGAGAGAAMNELGTGVMRATDAASKWMRPASNPAIVPPIETQAERVAQTILPPGGIKPELVKSLQRELPEVKHYAQQTGNPLNTQAEALKASRALAQQGLEHFNSNIAKPFENERMMLPNNVSPELGHSATLGEIQGRISRINHMLDTAKANSQGAALDAVVQSGLDKELGALKNVYYEGLSKSSGIPIDQLKTLREGYGSGFSLADQIEAGRNARMTRTGMMSQGQSVLGTPHSVWDLPERFITWARGGPEAIADRQFSSRVRGIEPRAPFRPTPSPQMQAPAPMPPISDEVMKRISAVETEPPPLRSGEMTAPKPVNGPLPPVSQVPALRDEFNVSKQLENEQNAAFHGQRMAREATKGTRLQRLLDRRGQQ